LHSFSISVFDPHFRFVFGDDSTKLIFYNLVNKIYDTDTLNRDCTLTGSRVCHDTNFTHPVAITAIANNVGNVATTLNVCQCHFS